jgi:hypothetical protein
MTTVTAGATADGARALGGAGQSRLHLHRNPLRLVASASPWRGAWYLTSYVFLTGWLLFAIAVTATSIAAGFAVTLAGIPLLVAASGALRGCADLERRRLLSVLTEPVRGRYRPVTQPGILAQVRTRWRDPATWYDVAYLIGLWPVLFVLDTVAVTIWLTLLALVTLPAWYSRPEQSFSNGQTAHGAGLGYFPNGPHGPGAVGWYVDTMPRALLAAAVSLLAFLLFNYVLVATARAHARIAAAMLRAHADPLAAAKEVLARPGPLGSLHSQATNSS